MTICGYDPFNRMSAAYVNGMLVGDYRSNALNQRAYRGAGVGAWIGWNVVGPIFANPPADATNPNGSKAPGMPGKAAGYCEPKGGRDWTRNPNGRGNGWRDFSGDVWVPTGPGGRGSLYPVASP